MDLAVNWFVEYKFKNWQTHRTDTIKLGKAVTSEEKIERAKEIVTQYPVRESNAEILTGGLEQLKLYQESATLFKKSF